MKIITGGITVAELKTMASGLFGNFVKGVVDVERSILALDAELHADLEAFLIQQGSKQTALWGINLYPELEGDDFLEFDSMINIKPSQGNRSRSVNDPAIREEITRIVNKAVKK